jgi:hypothetical protein
MRKFTDSRRPAALIAVYVIALQALLLPLSVAAGAAIDSSVCATQAAADGAQPPGGHDTGCACAAGCGMPCCGQALTGPSAFTVALELTPGIAMTLPSALAPIVLPAQKRPQVPRAPPAA